MKIATYNINGITARLEQLVAWLDEARPDVVCLQELKVADLRFPAITLEKAGYGAVWQCEKAYNGVAILARGSEPQLIRRRLPGEAGDTQARYIEAAEARLAAIQPATLDAEVLGKVSTKRDAPRLPFAALLESGLLLPGQTLYLDRRRDLAATVLADGTLRATDGARGSIHRLGAALRGLPACNGWEHWFYEDEAGALHPIDDLRERLRSERGGQAVVVP